MEGVIVLQSWRKKFWRKITVHHIKQIVEVLATIRERQPSWLEVPGEKAPNEKIKHELDITMKFMQMRKDWVYVYRNLIWILIAIAGLIKLFFFITG